MARLTPDALVYGLHSAGDPQLSPDGTRVLYASGAADKDADRGTSQIWLADRDGSRLALWLFVFAPRISTGPPNVAEQQAK